VFRLSRPLTQFAEKLCSLVGIGEVCSEHVEVHALIVRVLSRASAENHGYRADELRQHASAVRNRIVGQWDDPLWRQ